MPWLPELFGAAALQQIEENRRRDKLATVPWDKASIAAAIKETLAAHGLKMGQLAPAVRVVVCGRAQTPSLDAVLALFPRRVVQERLREAARAPL